MVKASKSLGVPRVEKGTQTGSKALSRLEGSAISLFAGCGGSDLGLIDAGLDVVWANEKNESACRFYESVVGHGRVEQADVASIDQFKKVDVLSGCYPCQGYSQGGVREASAGINYLYRQFDRALRQVRPLAFVVENVDGMRFSQNHGLLQNQLKRFRLAGYRVSWRVLDAKDFGLAETRRRLFIVGVRSNHDRAFSFPEPTHGPTTANPYQTQRDVIWKWRELAEGNYNDEPFHWYYLSRNRRQEWDGPAATVVARARHVGLHPDSPPLVRVGTDKWRFKGDIRKARRLSYLECAALQGFPDPLLFKQQTINLRHRAIGNAVPPPLFAAVAKKLVNDVFKT